MEPPAVTSSERNRRLLAQAEQAIRERGLEPTTERIAEQIGRDPRTVRRMRREVSADVRSAT
jgi:hypothetical protein